MTSYDSNMHLLPYLFMINSTSWNETKSLSFYTILIRTTIMIDWVPLNWNHWRTITLSWSFQMRQISTSYKNNHSDRIGSYNLRSSRDHNIFHMLHVCKKRTFYILCNLYHCFWTLYITLSMFYETTNLQCRDEVIIVV
jgi:hypothetical protein